MDRVDIWPGYGKQKMARSKIIHDGNDTARGPAVPRKRPVNGKAWRTKTNVERDLNKIFVSINGNSAPILVRVSLVHR